jgi:hypothetical protein
MELDTFLQILFGVIATLLALFGISFARRATRGNRLRCVRPSTANSTSRRQEIAAETNHLWTAIPQRRFFERSFRYRSTPRTIR